MYFTVFVFFVLPFLIVFLLPPRFSQGDDVALIMMPATICLMVTLPVSVAVVIRRMILRFRNRKKARRVLESFKHDAPVDTLVR